MYSPSAYNPLAINPSMTPVAPGILPLRLLIRQGGMAGYLLLLGNVLGLVTTRQRAEGYDAVDGSAMIQVLYALVCFLCAVRYLTSPQNRPAARILVTNPVVFFLLYIVLCCVSGLWSPRPVYTAFMAFQCLAYLLLIVAALSEVNRRCSAQDVIEWGMLCIVWTILWSLLTGVYVSRDWQLFLYPFRASHLSTGAFFFVALFLAKRRLFGSMVVAFVLLSVARSNYFGMAPGVLCGAMLGDRKSRLISLGLVAALSLSILIMGPEDVLLATLFRGKEGIGWEHTTGRDKIFALSWELVIERPWIGYGFVAGERDVMMETRGASVISTHSMFFSALLGVGFLGPLLLLLYFLGTWIPCLSDAVHPLWRFVFSATIFMVFVVSMANPGLGGRVYGAWLSAVMVMTMIAILCKSRVQEPFAWNGR